MKPIKVNYTKDNNVRTSTTINGQIAEAYFKSLFELNSSERLSAASSKTNYAASIASHCQAYINRQNWHDKSMIERFLLHEIIEHYRLPF